MNQISKVARLLSAVLSISALSGCGDYVFTSPDKPAPTPTLPTGINSGGTGTPSDALSRFSTPTSFTATAHRGLEIANAGTGLEAAPTLSFELTTTGFDMKTSEGTVRYDTRNGSTDVRGTNSYRACIGTCTTTSAFYDVTLLNGSATTLQYATYGTWTKNVGGTAFSRFGAFAVGVPSTEAQVPTRGTATFNGQASGLVSIDGPSSDLSFSGTTTLNADFNAKTITGSVTNIITRTLDGTTISGTTTTTGSMNNINFTNGGISGTGFNGTATPATNTGQTLNIGGTTGQFNGTFFGPNASEAAGSFTLTRDGLNVIGAFGTAR